MDTKDCTILKTLAEENNITYYNIKKYKIL